MKHRYFPWAILLCCASPAWAQGELPVTTAREVAKEGLDAFDAGRYEEAQDKLWRAYQVVHVPTLALYTARALVRLGRLVRASELYLEAIRMPPDDSWQPVQRQAQIDADRERTELLPKIPKLAIALEGAQPNEVVVQVDGTAIPSALLAFDQLVDPGRRSIRGQKGSVQVQAEATLGEGERRVVTLRFAASPPSTAVPQLPAASPAASGDTSRSTNTQRWLGWTAVGLGGAGLLFGGITGGMLLAKHAELEEDGCVGTQCWDDQRSAVDSHNRLRTLSTVGFVVGGVGVAAGITLVLTAPRATGATMPPSAALLVGPSSLGLGGRF